MSAILHRTSEHSEYMPELNPLPDKSSLGPEPQLDLLLHNQTLEEPIWKSLFRNIDEFFFPKKLPPLVLTSKPVPVRDIWGFYNYSRRGAVGSTGVPILAVIIIILITYLGKRIIVDKPKETVVLIAPDDMPVMQPSKTMSGGGGGGGDRDKLQASTGRLSDKSVQQWTPPMAVVRNENPKLEVEPTVVIPPEVKLK